MNKKYTNVEFICKKFDLYTPRRNQINKKDEKNKKDKHAEVICKKFDIYKYEMDKEFVCYDYPYCNLTPRTNCYDEDEQIAQEYLDFEKWFDEVWIFAKMLDESIKADKNTKRHVGSTLIDWILNIVGLTFLISLVASI